MTTPMGFAYRDIEEAYFFVNAGQGLEHNALLCKDTGEIPPSKGDPCLGCESAISAQRRRHEAYYPQSVHEVMMFCRQHGR